MICYLPFTHISDSTTRSLVNALGTVTVYLPAENLATEHMRHWAQKGVLDLRPSSSVDGKKLMSAVREFKDWATLHQGNISDLAPYFKTNQGQPPLVSDTDPTQISSQIRNFAKFTAKDTTDSVFRAALFMAMAQEYDQHQDDVDQGLGAIQDKERVMFAKLDGTDGLSDAGLIQGNGFLRSSDGFEPGIHMTSLRIESWAELVRGEKPAASLFVTTSPAIYENMLDALPDAEECLACDLGVSGHEKPELLAERRQFLHTLACAENLREFSMDAFPVDQGPGEKCHLKVHALVGCPPQTLPARLLTSNHPLNQPTGDDLGLKNSLIGLMVPGRL